MQLPLSRTALDRLGRRLADSDGITEEDYILLERVLTAYQGVLDSVSHHLEELGFQPATRVKTVGTLVDKLRREPGLKLKAVQDIAGARIVVPGGRRTQDDAVAAIERAFHDAGRPPRVRDRREEPSHGYRAVHVIPLVAGLPVEIQVRTVYQDLWAQLLERLGDLWGRTVRYGGEPDDPTAPISTRPDAPTRQEVFTTCMDLSEPVHQTERLQLVLADVERSLWAMGDEPGVEEARMRCAEVQRKMAALEQALHDQLQSMRRAVDQLE